MLAPKNNTVESGMNNPVAHGFLSEAKNSIDIAVIGNSDAYSGFSPMELWNAYGYTSYVSGEGRQSVAESYAILSNILTVQSPKVVILETDEFFTKSTFIVSTARIVNARLGSPFSIFRYHDRWKTVQYGELFKKPNYTARNFAKGQWLSNDVKPYKGREYMVPTDQEESLSLSVVTSLNTFVKACRDNDIELILLELPSKTSWNYLRHNAVQHYAEENHLPFLDLNLDRDRFAFNWETDTRDKGNHLNIRGARKTTLFIGKYLAAHTSLPDHRGDSAYDLWNQDFQDYAKAATI